MSSVLFVAEFIFEYAVPKCISKYHRTFDRSVKILREFVCFLDVVSWYPKRRSAPVYEHY